MKNMILSILFVIVTCAAFCTPNPTLDDVTVPTSVTEDDVINELLSRGVKRGLPKSNSPFLVHVGIYLGSLTKVNLEEGYVEVGTYLSATWTDPRLRFQYSQPFHDVKDVRLSPSDVWVPDIEAYDVVASSGDLKMNTPVLVDFKGTVSLSRVMVLRPSCDVSGQLTSDPNDPVTCKLKFGSWTYGKSLMDLAASQQMEPLYIYKQAGQWNLTSASVERNEVKFDCCPKVYVDVTITFTFSRREVKAVPS